MDSQLQILQLFNESRGLKMGKLRSNPNSHLTAKEETSILPSQEFLEKEFTGR